MSGYSRRQRKTKSNRITRKTLNQSDFQIKKLTRKSKREIKRAKARINIFEGAVRATKTITTRYAWLKFILESPYNNFVQAGKTRRSLLRNVLVPQMAIMDAAGIHYEYRAGEGYLNVEGKICWLLGCHNETAAEIIKGMTLGGADLDEADTYPKTVMDVILDRLSLEDARAYMTMNSNSPFHYIKTDFMDNQPMIDAGKVYISHWELYDNPFLPKDYIETMEMRYPVGSLGWKRKIKGLWVLAEGAIYDRFVEAQHTFEQIPFATYDAQTGELRRLNYDYFDLTTDYGPGNVSTIGLFGVKRTNHGNLFHLLNEFYYDVSKHNGRQLTDSELADEGLKLLNFKGIPLPLNKFWTPHDASSFRAELAKKRYNYRPIPVETYTPDVINDINAIKTLIAEDRFKISNKNCPMSISQAQSYIYDPRQQKLGIDVPLKQNDHCPDMWRAAILGSNKVIDDNYSFGLVA